MELNNLRKLYAHELKDLYSVETQILDALPDMIDKASCKKLKASLKDHLSETKKQRERIETIMKDMEFTPSGHKCKGIEGILAEAKEVMEEVTNEESRDAAIISMCNRVEHYELAGYGTARAYAEQLHRHEDADMLVQSMNEESAADQRLTTLAWRKVNYAATEQAQAN